MINLIQELQQSPKWSEFVKWYESHYKNETLPLLEFINLLFEFQKGVFEKFIENRGYILEKKLINIPKSLQSWMTQEELLTIKYLEEWYIKTIVLNEGHIVYLCINPTPEGVYEPFYNFEELLIWYFKEL